MSLLFEIGPLEVMEHGSNDSGVARLEADHLDEKEYLKDNVHVKVMEINPDYSGSDSDTMDVKPAHAENENKNENDLNIEDDVTTIVPDDDEDEVNDIKPITKKVPKDVDISSIRIVIRIVMPDFSAILGTFGEKVNNIKPITKEVPKYIDINSVRVTMSDLRAILGALGEEVDDIDSYKMDSDDDEDEVNDIKPIREGVKDIDIS